jgi:hypothetical protein
VRRALRQLRRQQQAGTRPKSVIDAARAVKWRRGRRKYGGGFRGHPLEELDEELLDA